MKKLNPAQLDAVSAETRTLQILAGPGSGKTRGKKEQTKKDA